MITEITEDEFPRLLAAARVSLFRLETCEYAIDEEREEFDRWRAGEPVEPPDSGLWRPWLGQVAEWRRRGVAVVRARVLADGTPTEYQRWMIWAEPWYADAGEHVIYMRRREAADAGVPLGTDWWLIDDARVIVMWFTAAGEIAGKILITDPGIVAVYRAWRDLAKSHATAAGEVRAA